jgi:hypothetical protein
VGKREDWQPIKDVPENAMNTTELALTYYEQDMPYCCGAIVIGDFSVEGYTYGAYPSESSLRKAGQDLRYNLTEMCTGDSIAVSCVTVSTESPGMSEGDKEFYSVVERVVQAAGFKEVHEWTNPNTNNLLKMWVITL